MFIKSPARIVPSFSRLRELAQLYKNDKEAAHSSGLVTSRHLERT